MPLDPMPDWVHQRRRAFGERLKQARDEAGLSQLALANQIGVDHRTIHRIEYATSDPPLSTLLLIAHVLEVPVSRLLEE